MTPISTADNPVDLLDEAVVVLTFLADATPALQQGQGHTDLDETSAHGLCLILQAVSATITQARRMAAPLQFFTLMDFHVQIKRTGATVRGY